MNIPEQSAAVRNYNPNEDYPAVQAILQEAKLYDPDRDTEEALKRASAEHPDSVLVASLGDGVPVGCIYVNMGIMPFLWRLAVRESERRQGIGSLLLQAGIDTLRAHGHSDVEVFTADQAVIGWLCKRGFGGDSRYVSMWRRTA